MNSRKKNPFILIIAVLALIWIVTEIIWIAFKFSNLTSFSSIFSIFILFLFMWSWIRIFNNSSYIGITWFNIIDIVYTIFIYVSTTSNFWHHEFITKFSADMVIFWILTLSCLCFNLSLISYILICNTKLGGKALKAMVWKNTYKAKVEVERKKNMIHMHEIINKIMCVNIDHVFPNKEENIYYAAILAKNPIDENKANQAEYLFVLIKQKIVAVYAFKPDQKNLIKITKDNIDSILKKFNSVLINEKQINKFILNVQKSQDTVFSNYVEREIDTINKSECFYNF